MEILVIGDDVNWKEWQAKFGGSHSAKQVANYLDAEEKLQSVDVIFDFLFDPAQVEVYRVFSGPVFLEVSRNALRQAISTNAQQATFFGFCGLPTLLNREVIEVSCAGGDGLRRLEETCDLLSTKFAIVRDQVGLITPRVVSMIINEAYFAIQENIASRVDIDLAMKLGTNYPFGPFEWCSKIGIRNVYETLHAVYTDTHDERYKVCELLKKEAVG